MRILSSRMMKNPTFTAEIAEIAENSW